MAGLHVPQCVRWTVTLQAGPEQAVNVFHTDLGDSPNGFSLGLAESIRDSIIEFYDSIHTYLGNGVHVTRISGRELKDDPTVHDFDTTSADGSGGNLLPLQCAAVITWRTAVSSRSKRGRTYIGPLGRNVLSSEPELATGVVTGLGNGAMAFVNRQKGGLLDAVDTQLLVVSAKNSTKEDITHVSVGNVVDTQRRRRNAWPEKITTFTAAP